MRKRWEAAKKIATARQPQGDVAMTEIMLLSTVVLETIDRIAELEAEIDVLAIIKIVTGHAWKIAAAGDAPSTVLCDIERLSDDPATAARLVAEFKAHVDGRWKDRDWPTPMFHVARDDN